MTGPVRVGEVLPGVVAEAIARAGPGYERWAEQVAATGYCTHPVRLRGRVPHTGEVCTVYSTDREPDATLLKACGNRRTSVCPSCSATYQADSFHLLAAGLRGGKGVPETVTAHPRLFVTFTAPSFGQVHSRKAQGRLVFPCHPYRQGQSCPHGRRLGCWQRHDEDDPRLGEPLCARCYQAGAQVPWNALAGRLWSRTTIYVYRALAQLGFTAELLEAAVRKAAEAVTVPCPVVVEDQGVTLTARWGEQLDVRHITEAGDDDKELSAEQVAGSVAKYATAMIPAVVAVGSDPVRDWRDAWLWTCRPAVATVLVRRAVVARV